MSIKVANVSQLVISNPPVLSNLNKNSLPDLKSTAFVSSLKNVFEIAPTVENVPIVVNEVAPSTLYLTLGFLLSLVF